MLKIYKIAHLFVFIFFLNSYGITIKNLLKTNYYPKVTEQGELDLSNLKLNCLDGINAYPGINYVETLIIRDNNISSLTPLSNIQMPLKKLDAASNRIREVCCLSKFNLLEEIYLDANNIDDENLAILLTLPKLKELLIDDNPLKNFCYRYAYQALGKRNVNFFEMIKLYDNRFDNVFYKEISNKSIKCSICQNNGEDETLFLTKSCHHYFHKECLYSWLKDNDNCPNCRGNLFEE